jgi:superfamily II DNA or RNA helicase
MRLRPYQEEAVAKALAEFDRGVASTAISMPTGTGKTVVFAACGDSREWGRVLVLAGRQELIEQAQDKIYQVTGEKPDIDMGQQYSPMLARDLFASGKYVCGSVQTVSRMRRLQRYDWKDFGLIVVDEGHHALAPTYRRILDTARAANPQIKALFVSATFDRGDGKAMGQIIESVAYRYDINDAIKDGYLVPVHQQFAHIQGLDFSHVRTKGGDLDSDELAAVLADDGGEMPHKIASAMVQAAGEEKAVIFTVDVASAYRTADIINRIRGRQDLAVAMDGTWDKDRRRAVLASYERGEFQYLLNCNLFVEGWDSPTVSVVGMARPTKSRALYAQAVGRGLRPLPGLVDRGGLHCESDRRAAIAGSSKTRCLVVDLVGNAGRHKLVSAADLLGGDYEEAVVCAAKKRAAKRKGPSDMKKLLEEEKDRLFRKREAAERRREADKRGVYANAAVEWVPVDPFLPDVMPGAAGSDFLRTERPASAGQVNHLKSLGVDARGMSFESAQRLIAKSFARRKAGLCPLSQMNRLEAFGYPGEKMTQDRANAVLDLIRANGDRRPEHPIQREQLSIKPYGENSYRLVARVAGRKILVGPVQKSLDSAREYGKLLLGS